MKREMELKILDIDTAAVVKRLQDLGAQQIFSGLLRTIYFDFPDRRIKKSRRIVRLRQEGQGRIVITLKGPRRIEHGVKIADEDEILVHSIGEARQLLRSKGLRETVSFEKKRTSFLLSSVRVDIDEYPHIPPFLEIEALTKKEIVDMMVKLHLTHHKTAALGIQELLRRFYPNLALTDLHFKKSSMLRSS